MSRYFYIQIGTPAGAGAKYIKTEFHPMHPVEEAKIQEEAARQVTMAARGQLIPKEAIFIISAIELEEEVARARFPQDFVSLIG